MELSRSPWHRGLEDAWLQATEVAAPKHMWSVYTIRSFWQQCPFIGQHHRSKDLNEDHFNRYTKIKAKTTTASTFAWIPYDWQLNLTPPKQEAKNSAFPDPRALGVQLGSFWVSLAPIPIWTRRKCCWFLLILFCVCLCGYLVCLRR